MIDASGSAEQAIQDALAKASRALPAGVPRAHIFLEERYDLRATFRPSRHREVLATRSRGIAIAAGIGVHVTDPDLEAIPELTAAVSRGEVRADRPESTESDSLFAIGGHTLLEWVDAVVPWVDRNTTLLGRGTRTVQSNIRLVVFDQKIWVAGASGVVVRDRRRGARVAIRLTTEGGRGEVSEDLVLGQEPSAPDDRVFGRMLERVEAGPSNRSRPIPLGQATAVFAPGAAGVLAHELFGHAAEADALLRGGAWLASAAQGSIPAALTIVDDPRRGRGAWRIDDEGTPARAVEIVREGRLVSSLHDRETALALGVEPTGHGRRASYLDGVRPRMGCTFISAGQHDPEEILRGTPKGIFIRRIAGGQVDPRSGRGRFIVTEGDRIVAGRCAEPLRPFVVEIDARSDLAHLDRIGHDLVFDTCVGSCVRDGQPLAVSVGAPTIRLGVVTVIA